MDFPYRDILLLSHPISATHMPMSLANRAAQFAPFAALTGHEAAIAETARLTERWIELDDGELQVLDRKWQCLCEHRQEQPLVTVTYFQEDAKKDGGAYRTAVGTVVKTDYDKGYVRMSGGEEIPFGRITALDSPLFVDLILPEDVF